MQHLKTRIFALAVLLCSCTALPMAEYHLTLKKLPDNVYQGIRLHGTLDLDGLRVGGEVLGGLSGLAWDGEMLYAVSDAGILFHLRPRLADGELRAVEAVAAWPLRNIQGRALGRKLQADAEGLVLRQGPAGPELLVSFERAPRVARYSLKGDYLGSLPLPAALEKASAYRDANQMIEALAWHPRLGLLAAPEKALRAEPIQDLVIYAGHGPQWRLPVYPASNSGVVALEVLDDGSLLLMERAVNLPFLHLVISLRRFWPEQNQSGVLAVFDNQDDWRPQNFEGLACKGRACFIVSDDNFSALQKTLLTYFEILPAN